MSWSDVLSPSSSPPSSSFSSSSFLPLPLLQAELSGGAVYESHLYKVVAFPQSGSSVSALGSELMPVEIPLAYVSFPASTSAPTAQWTISVPAAAAGLTVWLDLKPGTNHLILSVEGINYMQVHPLVGQGKVSASCPAAWAGGLLTFRVSKEGDCGCGYTNRLYVDPIVQLQGV